MPPITTCNKPSPAIAVAR